MPTVERRGEDSWPGDDKTRAFDAELLLPPPPTPEVDGPPEAPPPLPLPPVFP